MPKFDIQQQQSISGPRGASGTDFGQYQGLMELGSTIKHLGDTLDRYHQKKAHDKASVELAKTKAWSADLVQNELNNAGPGAEGLSDSVSKQYDQYTQQLIDESPGIVRRYLENDLAVYKQQLIGQSRRVEATEATKLAVDNLQEIVRSGEHVVSQDPDQLESSIDDVINYVSAQYHLSDSQGAELIRESARSMTKNAIYAMPAEDALIGLQEGRYNKYLDASEVSALTKIKQREQVALEKQSLKVFEQEHAHMLSNLQIAVSRGQATYSDIEKVYDHGNGWLPAAERTRLIKAIDGQVRNEANTFEQINRVNIAHQTGIPLDPKSKQDRAALNEHFNQVSGSWGDLDGGEMIARSIDYSITYGLVPERLKNLIRGSLRSGTAEQKSIAAQSLSQLRIGNPDLLREFNDQDISKGNLIASYIGYGISPIDAVRLATDSLNVPDSVKAVRKTEFKEFEEKDKNIKWLEDELDESVFSFGPTVPLAMNEEFKDIVKSEYMKHGDIDAARYSGLDIMSKVWGRTDLFGENKMMRYAPEKFYSVDGLSEKENRKWMKNQLISDVKRQTFMTEEMEENIEDNVLLTANPNELTPEGLPMYQINIKNDEGIIRPLRHIDGSIKYWTPSWRESSMRKNMVKKKEEELERLKERRESYMSMQNSSKGKRATGSKSNAKG